MLRPTVDWRLAIVTAQKTHHELVGGATRYERKALGDSLRTSLVRREPFFTRPCLSVEQCHAEDRGSSFTLPQQENAVANRNIFLIRESPGLDNPLPMLMTRHDILEFLDRPTSPRTLRGRFKRNEERVHGSHMIARVRPSTERDFETSALRPASYQQ